MTGVPSESTAHAEFEELLAAYALDAVDGDEATALERHLAVCPRCRQEVAAYRETAAMLAYGGESAPEGVFDRIAAGTRGPVGGEARRSGGGLDRPGSGARKTEEDPLAALQPRVPRRRRSGRGPARRQRRRGEIRLVEVALAVALVVSAGVIGFAVHLQAEVASARRAEATLAQSETRVGLAEAVAAALAQRGGRRIELSGSQSTERAELVLLPDGVGFLLGGGLRPLPAEETYQFWGIRDGRRISLGLLGRAPTAVPVAVGPVGSFAEVAITVEPEGGVATTSAAPVVAGVVSQS
jgi:anti-sigma factor RsiW